MNIASINKEKDIYYMKKALILAKKAFNLDEVPIGAIVVNFDGEIVGRGYNLTETKFCQLNHAECRAISNACKKLKNWRLSQCVIYVTVEPCVMCMGLISLSRIERLVYGTNSNIFGYHMHKDTLPNIYKKHIRGITSGVMKLESEILIKRFFKEKRGKR